MFRLRKALCVYDFFYSSSYYYLPTRIVWLWLILPQLMVQGYGRHQIQ